MKNTEIMNKHIYSLMLVGLLLFTTSCEDYVTDVDGPIDSISDDALNESGQASFIITGVWARFASAMDNVVLLGDLLSDQGVFDQNVPNSTFPSYNDIEAGIIQLDNNSVDGLQTGLGQMRLFSDDLVRRVDSGDLVIDDAAILSEAKYVGNLVGGMARYYYATYVGLNEEEGGGVISPSLEERGQFIGSAEMYGLAIAKLNEALTSAGDTEKRIVNSLIARAYLYSGDMGNAATHAAQGMVSGDEPFQSLYNAQASNAWYFGGGRGRVQVHANDRFQDYVTENPQEAARIPLASVRSVDDMRDYWFQDKYPERGSPITVMSWQENELMLAETELASDNASALARVNGVRASYGIDALAALDLDALIVERDKELFATGARLPDQRRFGLWHKGAGTWQYLPITSRERNDNPNLPEN